MDRSLDEFLDQSGTSTDTDTETTQESQDSDVPSENSDEDPDDRSTASSSAPTSPSSSNSTPARSTMVWTVDGVACESCHEVVQRRWRDEDQLVCNACKEW